MRILVIKPSSLGDIIHGLQVTAIIKKYLPNITIDWVVRDCWSEVVMASGLINKIFKFYRHGGMWKFCKLISDIREQKYDAVLDMQGLARTGLLTFFSRAVRKIGRWDAREFSRLAYNEIISAPSGRHAIDILLQFLPKFEIPAIFDSCLNFQLPNFSNLIYKGYTLGKYVLIFPESRRPEKQWPYFVPFVEDFASNYKDIKFVIIGQNLTRKYPKMKNIVDLSGATTVTDMFKFVQNCSLLVANDSAPIHIGAAMNKPVVAFFGPTDPERFGPYPVSASDHLIVRRERLPDLKVAEVWDLISNKIDKFLHDR